MAVKGDPGGFPQRKVGDVPAVTAAQMREIQRIAQEDFGLDILQIAENAGRACARLTLQMLGGRAHGQVVVILAGGGNKGAAGLAAARHLTNWGFQVEPVLAEVESECSFAVRRAIGICRASGIIEPGDAETTEVTVEDHLTRADLIIDALVGYGLEGAPVGIPAAATELAVAAHKPILALDIPTGVNATTGVVSTPAIRAVTTLILDIPKRGELQPEARGYVGELYLADLGIPASVHERLGVGVAGLFNEGPLIRLKR
jgi:NAD(P)H-hydrate epimerase